MMSKLPYLSSLVRLHFGTITGSTGPVTACSASLPSPDSDPDPLSSLSSLSSLLSPAAGSTAIITGASSSRCRQTRSVPSFETV